MMRLARALHAGRCYVRRRGVLALLRALCRNFVYRDHECLILKTVLPGPPAPDRMGEFTFRLATRPDLDRLQEFEPYDRGSSQRLAVLEDADWLFVACHADRIVMTRRYSRFVPAGLLSRVVELGAGQAWGADGFCLPEYRDRGIGRELGRFADRFMAAQGYAELLSSVPTTNANSIRMNMRIGRRPLYHVSYFRLLCYERLAVSREIPSRYWPEPLRIAGG